VDLQYSQADDHAQKEARGQIAPAHGLARQRAGYG
jgi:hypothetical protein